MQYNQALEHFSLALHLNYPAGSGSTPPGSPAPTQQQQRLRSIHAPDAPQAEAGDVPHGPAASSLSSTLLPLAIRGTEEGKEAEDLAAATMDSYAAIHAAEQAMTPRVNPRGGNIDDGGSSKRGGVKAVASSLEHLLPPPAFAPLPPVAAMHTHFRAIMGPAFSGKAAATTTKEAGSAGSSPTEGRQVVVGVMQEDWGVGV